MDDLNARTRVRGDEQAPVNGLLLDERGTRLMVCQRIASPCRAHPLEACLKECVTLAVDEDERAETGRGLHSLEELGVAHVRVRR